MKFGVLTILSSIFLLGSCESPLECLLIFAKEDGVLREDFPVTTKINVICDVKKQIFRDFMVDFIEGTLMLIDTSKVDCLMKAFEAAKLLEHLYIIVALNELKYYPEDVKEPELFETNQKAKDILEKSADTCGAEPSYDGYFDDILLKTNSTDAYCFIKVVSDEKIINLRELNVSRNPKNISTEDIDCDKIIRADRLEKEASAMGKYSKMFTDLDVECAMKKYRKEKMYEYQRAYFVITDLDYPISLLLQEMGELQSVIRAFPNSIETCSLPKNGSQQKNHLESVFIFIFALITFY